MRPWFIPSQSLQTTQGDQLQAMTKELADKRSWSQESTGNTAFPNCRSCETYGNWQFGAWFKIKGFKSSLFRSDSITSEKKASLSWTSFAFLSWVLHGIKISMTDPFVQLTHNECWLCALLGAKHITVRKLCPHQLFYVIMRIMWTLRDSCDIVCQVLS